MADHVQDSGRGGPHRDAGVEAGREPGSHERFERIVPVREFVHGRRFREACQGCPHCGRNFSCPPHSPMFPNAVGSSTWARVVCLRASLEPYAHLPPEERWRAGFGEMRRHLVEELLAARARGRPVLGSGACTACEVCATEEGAGECRVPERRIYSLESTGVDVAGLLRRCFGLALEWSHDQAAPGFVCSVGAVFLPERE